jgi:hypothetical protein
MLKKLNSDAEEVIFGSFHLHFSAAAHDLSDK